MSAPTSTPGLEAPMIGPKPKGLVPRSAVWLLVAMLLGGLIAYAIYDISRDTKRRKVDASKAPATALGGPPPADVLNRLMAEQAKASADAASAPGAGQPSAGRVALAVGGPAPTSGSSQPLVPPDVMARAGGSAPTRGVDMPQAPAGAGSGDKNADKAFAAHAELQARITASSLIAIEVKRPAGQRGDVSTASSAEEASGLAMGDIQGMLPKMPDINEIAKLIGAQQRGGAGAAPTGQPSSATRDVAWVKEFAEAKPAPITHASAAVSKNVLLQGSRIPAVTLEAMNSDLPGQITARATEDVRDSLGQRNVLVPAGTRFIGSYNAEVSPGQTRVLMAFSRMVLPDGRSVELHASQATDAIGQSGITGQVNNHFLKMYAYSLAVAIGGERLGNKGVTTGTSATGQATSTRTIAGEVLVDISKRLLDRNSSIPPTITTPVGERIYITITRDIALVPWKGQIQ